MGVAHRDIKAENILFKSSDQSDPTVKLCDFGLAIPSKNGNYLKSVVGSPYYRASEVISGAYDYRCDLWSVGILLFYMLSHTFPFKGQSSEEIF